MNKTILQFAELASFKSQQLSSLRLPFFIGCMLAGAYIGIGIILMLTISTPLPTFVQPLAMGVTFGIALTLVVLAQAELFTGYTMYMVIGLLKGKIQWPALFQSWSFTWLGNFLGAISLVFIYWLSQGSLFKQADLILLIATKKVQATPIELISKGILCNWLVCLAIWMSKKVDSDMARCVVIFWCLLAFIASGFEHSVANMALLSIAFLIDSSVVGVMDMSYNLFWVTIGNIIGGVLFVGYAYCRYSEIDNKAVV